MPPSSLTARIAGLLPDRVFTTVLARTYHRFEHEVGRLADFCPAHGTALDIGAWYGPWSRAFARRLDRVVALEPNPPVADVLTRTVPANVRVVRAAITDRSGTGTLFVPTSGQGTEAVASMLADSAGTGVEVPTTTIDELAVDDVTMIKIDVEGMELAALRGADRTLTDARPVLLLELEYRRSPVEEIVALLASYGYRPQVLVDGTWRPLADFDLAGHQRELRSTVDSRSYLSAVLRGGPHYVNNVVFLP